MSAFGLASSRSPSGRPTWATPNGVATTPHDTCAATSPPRPGRGRGTASLRPAKALDARGLVSRADGRRLELGEGPGRGAPPRRRRKTPSRRALGRALVEPGPKRAPRRASPRWWFRSPTPATEAEGTRRPGFSRRTARTTVTFRATRRALGLALERPRELLLREAEAQVPGPAPRRDRDRRGSEHGQSARPRLAETAAQPRRVHVARRGALGVSGGHGGGFALRHVLRLRAVLAAAAAKLSVVPRRLRKRGLQRRAHLQRRHADHARVRDAEHSGRVPRRARRCSSRRSSSGCSSSG